MAYLGLPAAALQELPLCKEPWKRCLNASMNAPFCRDSCPVNNPAVLHDSSITIFFILSLALHWPCVLAVSSLLVSVVGGFLPCLPNAD
jgi:hypothetical protein